MRRAGIAPDDLRIVIMRDTVHGEDHAVAAARLDGRWLTLDNRRMAMVEDSDIRNYRPTFVIDQHDVMRYADAPLVADASRPRSCNAGRIERAGLNAAPRSVIRLGYRMQARPYFSRRGICEVVG